MFPHYDYLMLLYFTLLLLFLLLIKFIKYYDWADFSRNTLS